MKRKLLRGLTLTGCFATGVIYGSIGVIAILSFMNLKDGGADESSFFVLLDQSMLGKVLNWIIISGAVCFIIWRFYEAFKDPYHIGNDAKGIMLRTGAAFSSGADAFIAFSALQVIFTRQKATVSGEPMQERSVAAGLLETEWGRIVIIVLACVVLLTALVLVFYGFSKRFIETIRANAFPKTVNYVVHGLAYVGYLSRGIILGITGFFYLKAVWEDNSNVVVNTDKAFDFIGDHIGGVAFILVAIGTLCYGLYMFVLGLYYDVDAGKEQEE